MRRLFSIALSLVFALQPGVAFAAEDQPILNTDELKMQAKKTCDEKFKVPTEGPVGSDGQILGTNTQIDRYRNCLTLEQKRLLNEFYGTNRRARNALRALKIDQSTDGQRFQTTESIEKRASDLRRYSRKVFQTEMTKGVDVFNIRKPKSFLREGVHGLEKELNKERWQKQGKQLDTGVEACLSMNSSERWLCINKHKKLRSLESEKQRTGSPRRFSESE